MKIMVVVEVATQDQARAVKIVQNKGLLVRDSWPQPGDIWDEDMNHPRSAWVEDVANGGTSLGYWQWVDHCKEISD